MTLGEVILYSYKMGITVSTIQNYEAYIARADHSDRLYTLSYYYYYHSPRGQLGACDRQELQTLLGPTEVWGSAEA